MEFGSNYQFNTHFGKSINFSRVLKNNCYFFTSGRMAIKFVVEQLKFNKIYLPNFLCEQVYNCFESLEKVFYYLSNEFSYEKGLESIEDNSIVFVSNYFGLSDETKILEILENQKRTKNIIVIYDITHSLFTTKNSKVVDFYVASIRKWFPIPDGGLICCDNKFDIKFESASDEMIKNFVYASVLKLLYVNSNNKDEKLNKDYRKIFVECEENLSEIKGYCEMSDYSKNYIENYNISVLSQRARNYNTLSSKLNNKNIKLCFDNYLREVDIPFSMPILCKKRDELRKYLMENQVYCAIHWNQDFMSDDVRNEQLSHQILSIPIDERYSENDMNDLAEILNKFGE